MPNIFAKISLVGEAETRDVKAIFIYCKKNADKRGKSRPIVAPRNWGVPNPTTIRSWLWITSRSLFLYHLSYKSSWGGMVDGRNSFADHVTYLAYVGSSQEQ